VLAALDHVNIVRYLDCFTAERGRIQIVMELCEARAAPYTVSPYSLLSCVVQCARCRQAASSTAHACMGKLGERSDSHHGEGSGSLSRQGQPGRRETPRRERRRATCTATSSGAPGGCWTRTRSWPSSSSCA